MPRGSRFADAAHAWMARFARGRAISTHELWKGLQSEYPDLTKVTAQRKTPRTTCMRDLRTDKAKRFVIEKRTVRLA